MHGYYFGLVWFRVVFSSILLYVHSFSYGKSLNINVNCFGILNGNRLDSHFFFVLHDDLNLNVPLHLQINIISMVLKYKSCIAHLLYLKKEILNARFGKWKMNVNAIELDWATVACNTHCFIRWLVTLIYMFWLLLMLHISFCLHISASSSSFLCRRLFPHNRIDTIHN